jgi:hypothetical protein
MQKDSVLVASMAVLKAPHRIMPVTKKNAIANNDVFLFKLFIVESAFRIIVLIKKLWLESHRNPRFFATYYRSMDIKKPAQVATGF